jgi:apolipoprotein D and lipocalin family protein
VREVMLHRAIKSVFCALLPAALAGCLGCKSVKVPALEVVKSVDLNRYIGVWYEIAHLPFKYQRGCSATTATYLLRADGRIDVLNRCMKGDKESKAKGVAWIVDSSTNARLKVRFFWPFSGDYWIIDLGKNYEYAVVGVPNRKYLWILSRTPRMDQSLLEEIKGRAAQQGFDVSRLISTTH